VVAIEEFWERVAEAAERVLSCSTCQAGAAGPVSGRHPGERGLPQPGWVGPEFQAGTGVVIVLQNPAVADASYGTTREQQAQDRLRRFAETPTVQAYRRFVEESIRDVVGDPVTGKRAWRKWTHPVSKVVDGHHRPEQLAWLNVVRFRSPATAGAARKDAGVGDTAIAHGILHHLRPELELLQPAAVVSIGSVARQAVAAIPGGWKRFALKLQGASDAEATAIGERLGALPR
jgi:hypothetical protein